MHLCDEFKEKSCLAPNYDDKLIFLSSFAFVLLHQLPQEILAAHNNNTCSWPQIF